MKACVWTERGHWYWDDSEDHSGYDRISPAGPFTTRASAIIDVRSMFPRAEIIDGQPTHYWESAP